MSISFKNFLYWEVSHEDASEIEDHISKAEENPSSMPFSSMMDGQLRSTIPLGGNAERMRQVEELIGGPGVRLDWKNGLVFKVDRDGNYQNRGKIAKQIGRQAKRNPKLVKELQDWYSQIMTLDRWTREELVGNEKEYTILISSHPMDVLRMSDVGEIESCHSPDGSYFNCAIADAQEGAMVAYLLRKKDVGDRIKNKKDGHFVKQTDMTADDWRPSANLKDFSSKGEFFSDKDREVEGLGDVVARLRIRKFVARMGRSKEWISIAVPEKRVYGAGYMEAFKDAVVDWARKSQKNIMDNWDKLHDISLVGGEYTDNEPVSLIAQLFNKPEEEVQPLLGQGMSGYALAMQKEELEEIQKKWKDKFKNMRISYRRGENQYGDEMWYFYAVYEFEVPQKHVKLLNPEHTALGHADRRAKGYVSDILQMLSYEDRRAFPYDGENMARARNNGKNLIISLSHKDYSDEPEDYDAFLEKASKLDPFVPKWKNSVLQSLLKDKRQIEHLPAWGIIKDYFVFNSVESWGETYKIAYKHQDEFSNVGIATVAKGQFQVGAVLHLFRAGFDPPTVAKLFGPKGEEPDIKQTPIQNIVRQYLGGNPRFVTEISLSLRKYSSVTVRLHIDLHESERSGRQFMKEVKALSDNKDEIEKAISHWITTNWGSDYMKQRYQADPKYYWPNHSDDMGWGDYDWDDWWQEIAKRT